MELTTLDLKKCIDLCRRSEAAASHLKNISGATSHDVHKLSEKSSRRPMRKHKYDKNAKNNTPEKRTQAHNCKFCGRRHPMKRELCPAWQKRCQKCNGRNHFSTVCRRGKPREGVRGIHEHEHDDSCEGSDYEFLSSSVTLEPINAVAPTSGFMKEIYAEMQIHDKRVEFQIDCGATINIINKRHAGSNVTPSNKTLKMSNGTDV